MSQRVLRPIMDGRLQVAQPQRGYRFSVDALLLSAYAIQRQPETSAFMELGAGSGVVSAVLAMAGWKGGVALEIQQELVVCAEETVRLNGLEGRVTVELGDLRQLQPRFASGSYPVVVSNPPFFPVDQFRPSPEAGRAVARQEWFCTMADLLSAMRYLLPVGGSGVAIYPVSRLEELVALSRTHKLRPTCVRFVHSEIGDPASLFLVELVKGERRSLQVLPPWTIRSSGGEAPEWYSLLLGRLGTA